MATVPGVPDNLELGLPKALHPTQADMLIAASIVNEKQRLAGDVVPMPGMSTPGGRADKTTPEQLNKLMTRFTLQKALGSEGAKVLPIKPEGN